MSFISASSLVPFSSLSSAITSFTSLRPAFILLLLGNKTFSSTWSSSNKECIDTFVLEDFGLLTSTVIKSSLVNSLDNGELFEDLIFSAIGTPLVVGIAVVDDLLIGEHI